MYVYIHIIFASNGDIKVKNSKKKKKVSFQSKVEAEQEWEK